MPRLLDPRHLPKLVSFATANVLVAFDFDGTLAPIVPRPSHARMRARTRRLLDAVARRYPCVVLSGRALGDIAERLEGIPLWHIAGNHGIEPWEQTETIARKVHAWVWQLRKRFAPYPGIVIEDKTYSVTVHYRRARTQRRALATIKDALRHLPGALMMQGNCAVNLLPEGAPHKGEALERLTRLLGCDAAIYVGDDGTDEPAFGATHPARLLSIRIGTGQRTRARYHLDHQRDIDKLLEVLATIRPVREDRPQLTGYRGRASRLRQGSRAPRRSDAKSGPPRRSDAKSGRVRPKSDAPRHPSRDRVRTRSGRRSF
jgi:trehalose 6-phosphate phosphatase